MISNNIYHKYLRLLEEYKKFNKYKIPLCAAETVISDFVRTGLSSEFEGKYCMGNRNYNENDDFIGSKYIHQLFTLVTLQCKKLFNAKYADARTLSGMNCMAVVISSILKRGMKVLLTTSEQGGHSSIPILLGLNGIIFDEIPYDYLNKDIDYNQLNDILKQRKYDALIFAQSDLLIPVDVDKIIDISTPIIYDATQTFGMIASKIHKNPLNNKKNILLIGGTHKTLPGPTSGLILTNNDEFIKKLDISIGPQILRNVQPNNIASVLLSLIEIEQIGYEYESKIVENANFLGNELVKKGLNISKNINNNYSDTHQLFIICENENQMNLIYNNARQYGITLNKKIKKLFDGFGIRLGVQEITRYGWTDDDLIVLAEIIYQLTLPNPSPSIINKINYFSNHKINKYVFNDLISN